MNLDRSKRAITGDAYGFTARSITWSVLFCCTLMLFKTIRPPNREDNMLFKDLKAGDAFQVIGQKIIWLRMDNGEAVSLATGGTLRFLPDAKIKGIVIAYEICEECGGTDHSCPENIPL